MKPASGRSPDAGFTMVEVVVAILIIGAAMFTVMMATSSGVVFQGMARQRQSAVAVGNKVMERLRALPLSDLQSGLDDTNGALQGDSYVQSCNVGGKTVLKLFSCTNTTIKGATEPLRVYDCTILATCPTPGAPLGSQNDGVITMDGVSYHWWAFLTQRSSSLPMRFTVVVDWTWRGKPYSTQVQSLAWSPEGCVSGLTHYVSAPCGAGSGSTGTSDIVEVSVTWTEAGAVTASSFSWNAGRVTGTYLQENTTKYVAGSASLPNGATASATADNTSPARVTSALTTTSVAMSTFPSGVMLPAAGATRPYMQVSFEDPASPSTFSAKAAATVATAGTCKTLLGLGLSDPFPFNIAGNPACMGVKSEGFTNAIVLAYLDAAGLSYPLVRIGPLDTDANSADPIWTVGYKLETGAPTGYLARKIPAVYLGYYSSAATYVGRIAGICDAIKLPVGGTAANWDPSAFCDDGSPHSGAFTKSFLPSGSSTACSVAAASLSNTGTYPPCASNTMWWFKVVGTPTMPGGLATTASLEFRYRVLKCTTAPSVDCGKARTYVTAAGEPNLGTNISALTPEFTVSVRFPMLSLSSTGYSEW